MVAVAFAAAAGVNYQCQCSLFKQFTTSRLALERGGKVSIINVNVLFLSNSQLILFSFEYASKVSIINVNVLFLSNSQQDFGRWCCPSRCQLSMSMFSF